MINTIPTKCPSCGDEMQVCLLKCRACRTEVQGEYPLDRFQRLTSEQLLFLETFIRCRGSLKDVGAIIGISYPTARNRLDNLIEALEFEHEQVKTEQRMEILTRLKNGSLSAEEALVLLEGGKKNE